MATTAMPIMATPPTMPPTIGPTGTEEEWSLWVGLGDEVLVVDVVDVDDDDDDDDDVVVVLAVSLVVDRSGGASRSVPMPPEA